MAEQNRSTRAGQYVAQPGGYRTFLPAALPPNPPVQLIGELQQLVSGADRALGQLDGSIKAIPHPDLFVYMYVRKEAVLSSQIEGTQSSLQDVLAAEAKILSPGSPKDVDEVINYVRAMNTGIARLAELPVSVRLIREIHAELLAGGRGAHSARGEIRTIQNWIGPYGATIREATFVPPPPQEVPRALADLERFIHAESSLPLVVKLALVHAQFETIHPFLDGNGRVGRLLVTLLLCEQRILQKPVLYLSYYLKKHRTEYYSRLQAVRDNGAWEDWLIFFLRGIIDVSNQSVDTAGKISALRETHRQTITVRLGRAAGNGHRLLDHLYEHPIVSVAETRKLTGTTNPAANNLVARMVDAGILREFTGRSRNRRFIYESYVNLFTEDTSSSPA